MHTLLVIHCINHLGFLQDRESANEGYSILAKKRKLDFEDILYFLLLSYLYEIDLRTEEKDILTILGMLM